MFASALPVAVTRAQPAASAIPHAPTRSITRDEAIAIAVATSTRHTIARSDSAAAAAQLRGARQYENPMLSSSYTGAAPQVHVLVDIPVDWPGQRTPRIDAARAQLKAAVVRLDLADGLVAFDTDTSYTRAQVLLAQSRLYATTARDADTLVTLARVRRDAGDASDLDVELATLAAGQSANGATTAMASAATALLRVQLLMGLSVDSLQITLADTIVLTAERVLSAMAVPRTISSGQPLPVAAAVLDVRAAQEQAALERRRRFAAPTVTLGVEAINPGGPGGPLPVVGVNIPLPLVNRNRAVTARADADLQRLRAVLAQALLEQQINVSIAEREAVAARTRAERSLQLVASAERISALSLLAYREGAATLMTALEAQRAARDTRAQALEDLATLQIADRLWQWLLLRTPTQR